MVDRSKEASRLGVFISYSRNDISFADQLDGALGLLGFATVLDRREIGGGEDWKGRLGALMRDTDTVVFVMSPSSAISEICAWEVEEAVRLGKRIIPVICRNLDGALPPQRIASLNYIFFYADPASPSSGFGTGLIQLVAALESDRVWLREHTRLLQRAVEWDAVGRPSVRLLSGSDVDLAKSWVSQRPRNAPPPTALHLEYVQASEEHERTQVEAVRQNVEERERLVREREVANAQLAQAVQREGDEQRKRFRARKVAIALSALAALLVGTIFAVYISLDSARLRERIARDEAQRRVDSLASDSRHFAERANQLIESGDAVTGINLVLEDLEPDPNDPRSRPRVAESHMALFNGLNENLERNILPAEAPVVSVAFGRNDVHLVAAGSVVEIYEAGSSVPKQRLPHGSEVTSALFSRDGTLVLTAAMDHKVRIFNLALDEVRSFDHDERIVSVAFDPTNRLIATASGETAIVWSTASGHRLSERKHDAEVVGVAWSSDSQRLFTATSSGVITGWNLKTNEALYKVTAGPNVKLSGISINNSGTRLVTSGEGAGAVALWNSTDGSRIAVLTRGRLGPGRTSRFEFTNAQFSPVDNLVVTTGSELLTAAWETERGSLVYSTQDHTREVSGIAFSPDGSRLMTYARDNTARVYSACDGRQLAVLRGHEDEIVSARFSADGCGVLTGSRDRTSRHWDLARRHVQTVIGEQLCTPAGARRTSEPCQAEASFVQRGLQLLAASFSDDGKWVATGPFDGKARVYDSTTGKREVELPAQPQAIRTLSFDRSGGLLATGHGGSSGSGMVRVWDWRALREVVPDGIVHASSVNSVHFSPDDQRLLTASGDGLAQVFEARSGKPLLRIETQPDCDGQRCRLTAAAWRPDGRKIATASVGNKACIWDVQEPGDSVSLVSKPYLCVEHRDTVTSVRWNQDGSQFVTASLDGTAIVWNPDNGESIFTLYGEDFDFRSAEFIGKGAYQQVMTRNGDRAIRFWDTATAEPVAKLTHYQAFLTSASIDKSGQRLLTASIDGTARIWTLPPTLEALAEVARARVPRCLSPLQRQRYNLDAMPIPAWCSGKHYGTPRRSEIVKN